MEVKIKDMQHTGWNRVIEKRYIAEDIIINNIPGVVSLSIWDKFTEGLIIDYPKNKVLIADSGYKWLQIALENQNFWLTAMYDNNDNFIEVYFDIIDSSYFENRQNPYFYDLFNDIVLDKFKDVFILDEDELEEAYQEGTITFEQYELVKKVTKELYEYVVQNKDMIVDVCTNKMLELTNKI